MELEHANGPGRPSLYTPELAERICHWLATGETLRATLRLLAERDGIEPAKIPSANAVRSWAGDPKHPFSDQYARAREAGYHAMADAVLDLADEADASAEGVAKARLRVDTRKWLLSKALPQVYGDRLAHEHTGKNGGPIEFGRLIGKLTANVCPADDAA